MATEETSSDTHKDKDEELSNLMPADEERRPEPGADGKNCTRDDVTTNLPVDRGWAWMILFGSASMLFVLDGVFLSSGLFFLQYQERFSASASKTTLILTCFTIFSSLTGLIVMTAGMKHMTVRTSVCIGGVLFSAAYTVSAFAENIEILIVALGAVCGCAASMMWLPALGALGIYFKKHRGLANSVMMCGGSVGALAFGPLYTLLFQHYGYSGTMLLASGVLLNIVAAGCLFRPPEFYNYTYSNLKQNGLHNTQQNSKDCEETHDTVSTAEKDTRIITSLCSRQVSNILKTLWTVFDLSLLKDPVYIHFLFFASIANAPSSMSNIYMIPFAKDIGVSYERLGLLLFILGSMDLVGRLSMGYIADKKIARPTTIMAVACLILAIMNNFLRLATQFSELIPFVVIQGCLGGLYYSLFAVILVEHVGQAQFPRALGFTNLVHGISKGALYPVTGFLRDVTGAYYWTYHVLGGFLLVAAILVFTLPYTHRRYQRNREYIKSIQVET